MVTTEELNSREEAAAKELFQLVNYCGGDRRLAIAISKKLLNEHRTLQQNFIRTVQMVVEEYAQKATTDLRNEDAKAWADTVVKATNEIGMRHI